MSRPTSTYKYLLDPIPLPQNSFLHLPFKIRASNTLVYISGRRKCEGEFMDGHCRMDVTQWWSDWFQPIRALETTIVHPSSIWISTTSSHFLLCFRCLCLLIFWGKVCQLSELQSLYKCKLYRQQKLAEIKLLYTTFKNILEK